MRAALNLDVNKTQGVDVEDIGDTDADTVGLSAALKHVSRMYPSREDKTKRNIGVSDAVSTVMVTVRQNKTQHWC